MSVKTFPAFSAVTVAMLFATVADAHITLKNKQAQAGAAYQAIFRVPHGCSGSATTEIRIKIPEGVIKVEPLPKAGWKLEVVRGKYGKSYDDGGSPISEGVKEVTWGGGELPDKQHGEFVMSVSLAADLKPDLMVYFPVVQACKKGVERWIEIPAQGKSADDDNNPAPGLRVLQKAQ